MQEFDFTNSSNVQSNVNLTHFNVFAKYSYAEQ